MSNTINLETTTEDGVVMNGELVNSNPVAERVATMPLNAIENTVTKRKLPVQLGGASLPLEAMLDVPITLVFEVGRTKISIKQLMEMCEGSYVELRNVSVDSIDIRVNDKVIAQAETIALPQRYGIRFGEVEMIKGSVDGDPNA